MKKIVYTLLLVASALVSFAQQSVSIDAIIKTPPNPARLVNDYANKLTQDQRETLERKLVRFDDSTSTQITVVIVNSTEGRDIADVAIEIGRSWGVGGKKNNNGVVLLIAITDRKLNISPGYGLEKVLPDLTCQQIIQDVIRPSFRGDDYYGGIDRGTDAIIQASRGEYSAPKDYRRRSSSAPIGKIIVIIVLVVVFLALTSGGGGGGGFMSRRGYRGFGGFPVIFPGGGGGGGWSGGGGSSGGGGFGGFGGGSFGGGGSSGSW